MTHAPYRFLAFVADMPNQWQALLEAYLVAFDAGEKVALVLAIPAEYDTEAVAAELETTIASWGFDLEGLADIELTPVEATDLAALRASADRVLIEAVEPAELRRLAGLIRSSDPRASIVVLTHNELEFTKLCLESVRRHTRAPYELVVVDNASSDGTLAYLESLPWVRVIANPENLGYARGCNQGIAAAQGRHVVLLNNDTIVTSGWLERLLQPVETDPTVGMVGPVSNYTTAWQALPDVPYIVTEGDSQHFDLIGMHRFARERGVEFGHRHQKVDQLAGFCMLLSRPLIERIGGLDDRFGIGFFEDSDYALRARLAGFSLLVAEGVFIHHFGSRSFQGAKLNTALLLSENEAKFKEKWGLSPNEDLTAERTLQRLLTVPFDPSQHSVPLPGIQYLDRGQPSADLTSIIILGFNQLSYTQLCIESIQRFTREPYELILVDNGSTDGTTAYFEELARRCTNVRIILNQDNLGFAAGCNQGVAASRGSYLLFLNNDTLVTDGWLGHLRGSLEADPGLGVVGPVSNYVKPPQLVENVPYGYDLEEIVQFAARWSESHAGQGFELDKIVGLCMLVRRDVLERIGGFDPRFGNGNYEDDDFCLRARVAGYRIRVCQDVFIHHFGSRTFMHLTDNDGYRRAMDRGWELFKEKWGLPPELSRQQDYGAERLVTLPFDPRRHVVPLAMASRR